MNAQEIYKKNSDFVYRTIAGETILVPIRKAIKKLQSIYSLNETACCIWQKLDGKQTLSEIAQSMLEEYEIDSVRLEVDMLECIGFLKKIGAVECLN